MKNKPLLLPVLIGLLLTCRMAIADTNTFTLGDAQYHWQGGVSSNAQYQQHTANETGHLGSALNDVYIAIEPSSKAKGPTFEGAVGSLLQQDIFFTTSPTPPIDVGLLYGWFNIPGNKQFFAQLGLLNSLSRYESPISLLNPNVNFAAGNRAMASYYTGVRLNFKADNELRLFAEYGAPNNVEREQLLFGFNWNRHGNFLGASYAHATSDRDILHLHGQFQLHQSLAVGMNLDYSQMLNFPNALNNKAQATTFYLLPTYGQYAMPLRIEFINDGDSNLYHYGKGYSISLTPTKQLSQSFTLRAEIFYAFSNASPFKDQRAFVENQSGATMQILWKF